MKTGRLIFLTALVLIVAPALLFAGKPSWTWLDAPVIENCTEPDGDNVVVADWYPVTGANKYSVEVNAGYDTDDDGCPDTYFTYEYSSDGDATSLEFDIDDFEQCFEYDVNPPYDCTLSLLPIEVSWKVKALNPPKGKYGSNPQNNPWSENCTVVEATECLPEI